MWFLFQGQQEPTGHLNVRQGFPGQSDSQEPAWNVGVSEWKLLSRVQLFATPGTIAHQAPLSVEFSRREYWSGLPFPSPGDLPNPGIEPGVSCIAGRLFTIWACQSRRPGFNPWVRKIPWRREWRPTPVFSPGELHGQRSLAVVVHEVAKMDTKVNQKLV